jgi:DNA gyrase inhibitor GyrI
MFEEIFIEVLEKSIEKHGEKPLTNKYLLNILRMVERELERYDEIPF